MFLKIQQNWYKGTQAKTKFSTEGAGEHLSCSSCQPSLSLCPGSPRRGGVPLPLILLADDPWSMVNSLSSPRNSACWPWCQVHCADFQNQLSPSMNFADIPPCRSTGQTFKTLSHCRGIWQPRFCT